MKRIQVLLASCCMLFVLGNAFSQTLFNAKNVDRTAMTFYDGQQTFRALEYTVAIDPQSQKVYRLQTLPENGFPNILLQGKSNGSSVFFEDKGVFDNLFTDNATPYLSAEAVQIYSGFQQVMHVFDERFGWKGIDGAGVVPMDIRMVNSDENPQSKNYSSAYYSGDINDPNFTFTRSIQNATPFLCSIDIIAHEFAHAIIQHRSNVTYLTSLCSEFRTVDEGLAEIFGIYVKNYILKSTPQNYNWLLAEPLTSYVHDMRYPKTYQTADTYMGEFFETKCTKNYDPDGGAGVVGKWFYLLSAGMQGTAVNDLGYRYGNLSGIGNEKAIQIIWDAMPNLKNYSDYPAFRTMTLKAAEQLYGSNSIEYKAAEKAWCAVGLCDNNLPFFTISPPNAASNVEPWPGVKVNFSWDKDDRVKEVEVQFSENYAFTNPQTALVDKFDMVFKPGGGSVYIGAATGHFLPGTTVYARVRITKADANFCKGYNPLCQLYQQFSPTHVFKLSDKKAAFWHGVPTPGFIVNAWDSPKIEWKPESGAETYTFQLATDDAFANLVYTGTVNASGNNPESGVIAATLETDKNYYVRVRAERENPASVSDNWGAWSHTDNLKAFTPPTSILQALNQKPNDPPTVVSSLGFWVTYYTSPGAFQYLVQIATDEAFTNIVRSQVAPGNVTNPLVTLPELPDQTELFVRALPQKGFVYASCTNIWRIKTDKNATLPAMKGPDPKVPISYKPYTGAKFLWGFGSVNQDLVHHFKLCLKEKGSGLTTCYTTPGKMLEKEILDQLMFDDLAGIEVTVTAVGPEGAESGPSPAFNYKICPDHPMPIFPSDIDKIDPSQPFVATWHPSQSMAPGDHYELTLSSNAGPVNGFNNAPTAATSMTIPAGTLGNGKTYAMMIKNSGSCAGINPPTVLFQTIAGGNNNPPATPTKDLVIQVPAYRNELDPADPFPVETSDYLMGFELVGPNGDKVAIVDANGNPASELWVDSENSVLAMVVKDAKLGKYTLKATMTDVVQPLYYNFFDQPYFSVIVAGQTIIDKHYIIANPFDPATDQWQDNVPLADITIDHN